MPFEANHSTAQHCSPVNAMDLTIESKSLPFEVSTFESYCSLSVNVNFVTYKAHFKFIGVVSCFSMWHLFEGETIFKVFCPIGQKASTLKPRSKIWLDDTTHAKF